MFNWLPDPLYSLWCRIFGKYALDDPRPTHQSARYTFYLPSQVRLDAVALGDHVQLIFLSEPPSRATGGERMWVEVTSIEGERLSGTLLNVPFHMPQLKPGAVIPFMRFHIISVTSERPLPADDPETKQYWDRCIVDRCVLDDAVPVYYIYREEPDMAEESDKYPDSGWRIRGDYRDISDEELDARKASYIALGKVLNADDSWLHLIDEPIGSAFMRNFETGVYEVYVRESEDD